MLDPLKVAIDHQLVVVVLTAYVVATLAFIGYFLFRSALWRQAGIGLAILACAMQFVELGTRWNMTGVWPLTNLYGSLSLFSALGVLIFLIFGARYDLWLVGGGVLGISAIAFGYATTWNEGYMPAVPALQSYWIKIHVPLVITSYASFMVAFVVASLYLLKKYAERHFGGTRRVVASAAGSGVNVAVETQPSFSLDASSARTETPGITSAAAAGDAFALWLAGLPTLARLDMMTYRIVGVGLPLLTVGIITGAMWANEAWGAYWHKSQNRRALSWIVYAAYMRAHSQRLAW